MPIEYLSDGKKYILSYQELRERYLGFCDMDDAKFIENLPEIIHLACIICFLKEIPTYVCLIDTGIIHELVHLLANTGTTTSLKKIRESFETELKLS